MTGMTCWKSGEIDGLYPLSTYPIFYGFTFMTIGMEIANGATDEDLHAKCCYNEKSMVIISLNLHEHSQQHNRGMGVLLNSKEDSNVFKEAQNEAEFIVSRAKK